MQSCKQATDRGIQSSRLPTVTPRTRAHYPERDQRDAQSWTSRKGSCTTGGLGATPVVCVEVAAGVRFHGSSTRLRVGRLLDQRSAERVVSREGHSGVADVPRVGKSSEPIHPLGRRKRACAPEARLETDWARTQAKFARHTVGRGAGLVRRRIVVEAVRRENPFAGTRREVHARSPNHVPMNRHVGAIR